MEKVIEKAIRFCDSQESDDKEMQKIYDEATKAVNMVNVQIRKLQALKKKISKYEWSYTQSVYLGVAIQKLEKGIDDALDALERGKP